MKRTLLCVLATAASYAQAQLPPPLPAPIQPIDIQPLLIPGAAHQPPPIPDLVVLTAHVNPVMAPENLGETVMDCIHDTFCKIAFDAAGSYLGVDTSTLTTIAGTVIGYERHGEDTDFVYPLPLDYEYCSSVIHTVSVVPNTGDRASQMQLRSTGDTLKVHTWTPKQPFSQGRTWIDAQLTVIGVSKYAAAQYRATGKCAPASVSERYIGVCRGGEGVNHGEPACKTIVDPPRM